MVSLRPRRVPALLGLLGLLAGLTVAGASTALVLVDESRGLRVTLSAMVAVGVAVFTLVSAPAVRPVSALSGRRRRGTAGFGRLLVVVCWLLRVVVAGAAAGYIAWNTDSVAVQPVAAVLVAVSMLLVVVAQLGQHLAGFVTAADDLRGSGLPRRLVRIAVAAVTAGVASYVTAVVDRFRSLVTDPLWDHARHEWGLPGFLAGFLVALVTILVVMLLAILVGAAMLSLAFAIGPWTVLGRWLVKFSPVKYTRWIDSAHLSVIGFSASFPLAPNERATRWIYEGVRDSTGPLEPLFLKMLADDVVRAVPAETTVVLRAVGDHEEILLEDPSTNTTRKLDNFPEAAALRRIRLALHNPYLGLPSAVRCSPGPSNTDAEWSTEQEEEPDWLSEPSHDDLVKEVVRHPPAPPWLRHRLALPEIHPDW